MVSIDLLERRFYPPSRSPVVYSDELTKTFGLRDEQNQLAEDMFLGRWADADNYRKKTHAEPIISTDPRTSALGVIRIMNAGEAQFAMDDDDVPAADDIVKAADLMWRASSKVRSRPLQRDLITSGVLFAEYAVTIDCVSDLVKGLEDKLGQEDKNNTHGIMRTLEAACARMCRIEQQTPYLFDVGNPSQFFPDMDKYGLRAVLRRVKVNRQQLEEMFGTAVAEVLGSASIGPFTELPRRSSSLVRRSSWAS